MSRYVTWVWAGACAVIGTYTGDPLWFVAGALLLIYGEMGEWNGNHR